MTPLNNVSSNSAALNGPQPVAAGKTSTNPTKATPETPTDSVSLSKAAAREFFQTGRIAADQQDGSLTSAQVAQIQAQESALYTQVATDQQANHGSLTGAQAAGVNQLQSELSREIYSDAHGITGSSPGNPAPPQSPVSLAAAREFFQTGRLAADQQDGSLTSAQVTQIQSQESALYTQVATDQGSNSGSLSSAQALGVNHVQTELSHEIYAESHGITVTSPIIPPAPQGSPIGS